jgi:V/A-type H+-transporting ATPase subunit E
MSINRITSSLLAEARKEAEEIVKAAELQATKMIEEEKAKKTALLKVAEDEIKKILKEREKERIAWAHLEAKRILAEAREDAIKSALETFFSLLKEIREHKEYPNFLRNCLEKALEELATKDVIVHTVKGDKKYLTSFNGKIVEDLDSFGGLVVETADNKIRINLTVEELFEVKRDNFRKKIYEKLFGKEGAGTEEETKEKIRKNIK